MLLLLDPGSKIRNIGRIPGVLYLSSCSQLYFLHYGSVFPPVLISVGDPWHFGTNQEADPEPRIRNLD